MTGYTENVRMYLSHNLFGPDKLLVCFYTFINWHAQTQEERRPKKMKNTIGNIFIWPFVTRCLCIACSGREIAVFRRCICFFRFGCVEGTYAPSFPVCKTKASISFFFFCGSHICWYVRCNMAHVAVHFILHVLGWLGQWNEHIERNYLFDIRLHNLILGVCVFFLYRYHSIRFSVGAWLLFRSCGVQQGIKRHRMLIRAARQLQQSAKNEHRPANSRYRCLMPTINP